MIPLYPAMLSNNRENGINDFIGFKVISKNRICFHSDSTINHF